MHSKTARWYRLNQFAFHERLSWLVSHTTSSLPNALKHVRESVYATITIKLSAVTHWTPISRHIGSRPSYLLCTIRIETML